MKLSHKRNYTKCNIFWIKDKIRQGFEFCITLYLGNILTAVITFFGITTVGIWIAIKNHILSINSFYR
jgi:mannitol-specific phosphotransferase system IIBC component